MNPPLGTDGVRIDGVCETDEAKKDRSPNEMRRWEVQSYKLSEQSGYTIDLRKMEATLLRRRKKFSCQREVVSCKIRYPRAIRVCVGIADVSSYSSLICYFINGKITSRPIAKYSPRIRAFCCEKVERIINEKFVNAGSYRKVRRAGTRGTHERRRAIFR